LIEHKVVTKCFLKKRITLAYFIHKLTERQESPTHLKQPIKVFRMTRKLKAGVFDSSWRWAVQDSRSAGAGLGTITSKLCF